MMKCPGLLSKGDLGPFHCHCLAHFQNYKLSVGGALHGSVVVELDQGGNRWAIASSNAWATLFNSLLKARNSVKMSTFGDLQKKRGKPLTPFSFPLFLLLSYISFIFCVGSQIQFCRNLNGLPQVVSSFHIVLWITGHCQCHITVGCFVHIRQIVLVVYEPCSSTDWAGFCHMIILFRFKNWSLNQLISLLHSSHCFSHISLAMLS